MVGPRTSRHRMSMERDVILTSVWMIKIGKEGNDSSFQVGDALMCVQGATTNNIINFLRQILSGRFLGEKVAPLG